ncbi:hypothetical protein NQ317_013370 [Molorchus minor]|uniref:Uncharacterized protein n=1 Tax=Molorchus minor TaxID=1323400 RepID=A0ABQ9J270_9CUCU|nr:hypothetical protein NQ317_013370 [Molorchus minor]
MLLTYIQSVRSAQVHNKNKIFRCENCVIFNKIVRPYFQLCKDFNTKNTDLARDLVNSMIVHYDFLNVTEETSILG